MKQKIFYKKIKNTILNQSFIKISLCFIMIAVLVISSFLLFRTHNNRKIQKEQIEYNEKLITNLSNSFEKVIDDMKSISAYFYSLEFEDYFNSNNISDINADNLKRVLLGNNFIYSAELIIPKSNEKFSITSNSIYSEHLFKMSTGKIQEYFKRSKNNYLLLPIEKPSSSSSYRKIENFCYVQAYQEPNSNELLGYMVYSFDRYNLRLVLGTQNLFNQETFKIINNDDDILLSTGDIELKNNIKFKSLGAGFNNLSNETIYNEKVNIYGSKELERPYKCVIINKVQNDSKSKTDSFIIFILLLAFVLSTYIFVVIFYLKSSLENVKYLLNSKNELKLDKMTFEDSSTIEGMLKKEILFTNHLKEEYDDHRYILRQKMLNDLFTMTRPLEEKKEILQFEKLGISLKNKKFIVMAFASKDIEDTDEKESELMRYVAENILKEYGNCYSINLKGNIVCLFSYSNIITKEEIKGYSELIIKIIKSEFGYSFKCGIGKIGENIYSISKSYYRAVSALDIIKDSNQDVSFYEDINYDNFEESSYLKNVEQKFYLFNLIKSKNFEEARFIIIRIAESISQDLSLSEEFVHLQIYELFLASIKEIFTTQLLSKEAFDEIKQKLDQCLYIEIYKKQINYCIMIFDEVIMMTQKNSKDKDLFVSEILDIIENEYSNLDLSVNYLAERLNVNTRTLSAKFIKKTGKGLLEYINFTRIEKSKNLLENTNKTLIEISSLVGYENVNTYIRIFKRYSEITPGQYRNLSQGKRL